MMAALPPVTSQSPLVLLVGPTAVGKTETAIQLAEVLGGEIVSADSRLFYRGMDIGTAKPSQLERERVHHHLIDIVNPDETLSLAVFQRMARDAIADIQEEAALALTRQMLNCGATPARLLVACRAAVQLVGQRYLAGALGK